MSTATPSDDEIRATIDRLLGERAADASICPSEVARALAPDPAWRNLMEAVRRVAAAERDAGRLEVRQRGAAVDPLVVRGPIRLARAESSGR